MLITLKFETRDIDALADQVRAALRVELHRIQSPMDGTHFTDTDIQTLLEARKRGERPETSTSVERYHLRRNDPEPGYLSREHPGNHGCNLDVTGTADELAQIQEQLERAGLRFVVLSAPPRPGQ
jgi:hypothetical protein